MAAFKLEYTLKDTAKRAHISNSVPDCCVFQRIFNHIYKPCVTSLKYRCDLYSGKYRYSQNAAATQCHTVRHA